MNIIDLTVDSDEHKTHSPNDPFAKPTGQRSKRIADKSVGGRIPRKSNGVARMRSIYVNLAAHERANVHPRDTTQSNQANGSSPMSPKQFEERTGGKLPSPLFPHVETPTQHAKLESSHLKGHPSRDDIPKPTRNAGSHNPIPESAQSYGRPLLIKPSVVTGGSGKGEPPLNSAFTECEVMKHEQDGVQSDSRLSRPVASYENRKRDDDNVEQKSAKSPSPSIFQEVTTKSANMVLSMDMLGPVDGTKSEPPFPSLRDIHLVAPETLEPQSRPHNITETARKRGIPRHATVDSAETSSNSVSSRGNPKLDLEIAEKPQIPTVLKGSPLRPASRDHRPTDGGKSPQANGCLPLENVGGYEGNSLPEHNTVSTMESDGSIRGVHLQPPISFESLKNILEECVRKTDQDHAYHIKVSLISQQGNHAKSLPSVKAGSSETPLRSYAR